ncbi:hypothetical protein FHS89_001270 [Rubricella aquisinus]|uniref:DUF1289 domain-containing protein n=1 Tax=Rubricella aquisinus TaxID=2028108 RepID=A0A840WVP1_9RHOB|nr:DUF1289 domain-containing protein [Rubricella aquisinus]MBB5515260.1 hypothetical protein [Rubricella aquisinus]
MVDEVWKRAEIESPCVKLCVIHPESRLCMGCLRSIDEIGRWSSFTADERRDIMDALPARARQIRGKRRTPRLKTRN